jgi:hypothetical protein
MKIITIKRVRVITYYNIHEIIKGLNKISLPTVRVNKKIEEYGCSALKQKYCSVGFSYRSFFFIYIKLNKRMNSNVKI